MKCDCCGAEMQDEPQYYRRVSAPCCSQACAASCRGTVAGLAVIDITPGPAYLAAAVKLFEEQKVKSHATIAAAEAWLALVDEGWSIGRCGVGVDVDSSILPLALEALIEQEEERIRHMDEGIAAAGGREGTR